MNKMLLLNLINKSSHYEFYLACKDRVYSRSISSEYGKVLKKSVHVSTACTFQSNTAQCMRKRWAGLPAVLVHRGLATDGSVARIVDQRVVPSAYSLYILFTCFIAQHRTPCKSVHWLSWYCRSWNSIQQHRVGGRRPDTTEWRHQHAHHYHKLVATEAWR